jgi:WD40 repeat protein
VWDLATGRALRTMKAGASLSEAPCIAVTPDGKRVISASFDRTLKVWDLETGGLLRTMEGHRQVSCLAVTSDGKQVVSGSDHTLTVWDLETGRALKVWDLKTGCVLSTLEGHRENFLGVTVDEKRAVSVSDHRTLKVWNLETGLPLAAFRCDAGVMCCTFADGQTIVAGDDSGRLHFLRLEERR